jgi:hypothetical protein
MIQLHQHSNRENKLYSGRIKKHQFAFPLTVATPCINPKNEIGWQ